MKDAKRTTKRKFVSIKKDFNSMEVQKKAQAEREQKYEEMKRQTQSLTIETPWNTDSAESNTNYKYHKISISKSTCVGNDKADKVISFLDFMDIHQLDFSGMLKEGIVSKSGPKVAGLIAKTRKTQNQGSSLLNRRKNRLTIASAETS